MPTHQHYNSRKKQFVHVVAQYLPTIGGAEKYCASISENLISNNYSVNVYTSRLYTRVDWRNELPSRDEINNVPIRRFSALKRGPITWRLLRWCKNRYEIQPRLFYELGLMLAEGPVCPVLTAAILRAAPQIKLLHIFGLYSAMAWQVAELATFVNKPLIITPFSHQETGNLTMIWKQRALNRADQVITMTNQEKVYLAREHGIPAHKVTVISPGINPADYPQFPTEECRHKLDIPDSAFVVMFLGRKEEGKGIATLLASCQELHRRGHDMVCLLFVGPDTPYSQKLLSDYSLHKKMVNLGSVDEKTKLFALNACDCLVLPSRSESFGIVLIEAWAVGKPVIAAYSAATAELIAEDQDGYLFPYGAVLELADRLEALLTNPARAAKLGINGQKKVLTHFTMREKADQMAQLYSSVLRKD